MIEETRQQPSSGPEQPMADVAPRRSLMRFGVVVATALIIMPLNSYWVIQSELVRYQGHPTTISLFYNVVFILFVLTLLNLPVRRFRPDWALTAGELMVIYIVLCIGSVAASHDRIQVLTPVMTYVFRFASPENGWAELIVPHMPGWLCMTDPASLEAMHEGDARFLDPSNFGPWLKPAGMWCLFTFAMWMVCLSLASIFRRRWVHSERLTYPIVMLPLEMVSKQSRAIPEGFYKNKAMWIAFGLALSLDIANGIHTLKPQWPSISVSPRSNGLLYINRHILDRPWNAMGDAPVSFYPFVLGLGLLLPIELAQSCWIFFWFWRMQFIVGSWLGYTSTVGFPWVEEQEHGGYLAITVFFLWASRKYLGEVWSKVWRPEKRPPDSGALPEGLSYRWAFIFLTAGYVFLVVFSIVAGMPWWMAFPFFILYFLISLAVGRIRAEMGLPAHDIHFAGPDQILVDVIGSRHFTPKALAIDSMYWWFNRALRSHILPHQAEAFKCAERTGVSNRRMVSAMVIAMLAAMPVAFWAMLQCDYSYGAATSKMSGGAVGFGREPTLTMAAWLNAPTDFDYHRLLCVIIGFAFVLTLMFLNTRIAWWPIHPAGYAVSASWSMQFLWCPLLIASTTKWAISRYGGHRAVQSMVPIAFGLILGDLTGGSFWTLYSLWKKVTVYSIWQ